jgi:hypothetical protein
LRLDSAGSRRYLQVISLRAQRGVSLRPCVSLELVKTSDPLNA